MIGKRFSTEQITEIDYLTFSLHSNTWIKENQEEDEEEVREDEVGGEKIYSNNKQSKWTQNIRKQCIYQVVCCWILLCLLLPLLNNN